MDKEHSPVLQELSNMHLKISYLFLDLIKEKNEFKQNFENLNRKIEQLSDETKNLKQENTALKQRNDEMKSIIENGIKVLKSLDFSNVLKEYKIPLEALKKTFFEFSEKMAEVNSDNLVEEKSACVNNTRCSLNYDEIQKEFEGLSDLNFFTNFSYNEPDDKNSAKRDYALGRSRSDTVLKSLYQNTSDTLKISREPSLDCENDSFDSKSVNTVIDEKISSLSPPLREMERCVNRSPVFKDFGIRRHDSLSNDEDGSNRPTSLSSKLINEKFLEKSDDLIISPWKKFRQTNNEKTPSKESPEKKRARKRLKINSPEKFQFTLLKKSNMREAEISFSGIRKLRQTLLNVDCFKKNNSENRENENFRADASSKKEEKKVLLIDEEDYDFITESPKKDDRILEDAKIKKTDRDLNIPFITPPQTSDTDLDETYVSSSLVQKCYRANNHRLKNSVQNQTPLKKEKSPEYCSVSFVYKREPVRKKVERMKLPGHACIECMKYYENALGDISTQDLKKILNKCSRHRDKNSPTLDDTPPGYWKPYLTCSTIISPNKDDVHKAANN